MRKILSLVLVLSMVLGSFGFAFAAPADVEGTDFEDAVTRLSALEILSGFPDGTFRPDETVTRAQFAKIMANALGVGTAAQYATEGSKFADVPAGHWAVGYINVVSDMKVINGYGDGNFGPEDKVTYAQAVTMVVRALGYEPKAKAMGGYPGGYIAIAAEQEITDDVNVVNTLAATRGDVALMVDNSLTVPMMVQKTWGQYPEYEEDEDKTLMKTKLGVDEVSGVVTAIPNTDSILDADEIRIDGDKYDVLVEGVNFDSLLGLEVTVWEDGGDILDFDIDTDEDEIFFDTVDGDSTKDEIALYVEDDSFEWADKAKAYVNFEEVDLDEVPANAYGYAVLNEKEEVTYVNVFDFNEVAVGAVYDVDGDVYNYVEPDANTEELDLEDYEDGIFIYNTKMELVDTDEIAVNSAIFAWETSDELYLVVKNEAIEGTLERIKDKEVKIDTTSYDKSAVGAAYSDDALDNFGEYKLLGDLDNLGDEAVVAVLDLNGELLLIHGDVESTSSTMYGVVTYGETGSKSEVTVLTKDDEEVDYVFETRTDGVDVDASNNEYFEDIAGLLEFPVMQFKLNSDGEIADAEAKIDQIAYVAALDLAADGSADKSVKLPTLTGSTGLTGLLNKKADKAYVDVIKVTGGAVDADITDNTSARYYISEDTVFMTALSSKDKLDPAVVSYENIYDAVLDYEAVYVIGTDDKDADMIVFLDSAFTGADDDIYYGVVTDSPWKDGSDYVVSIDVFDKGEEEYVVATRAEFTEGDVVAFKYNTDDEIVLDDSPAFAADDEFDYDDGYLVKTGDGTVKISSKAVVYILDDGAIDDTLSVTKLDDDKYEDLLYVLDEDEMVVAVTVVEKGEAAVVEETESDGVIAVVPYTVATDTTVRINVGGATKAYTVDPLNVAILDGFGTVITTDFPVGTKVNFTLIEGTDEIDIIKAVDFDETAPEMSSITIDSATQITITFDEKVVTAGTNPTDFVVTDEDSTAYVVSAQADGTAGDNKIVLTVADMSASEDKEITVTYTNTNAEVEDLATTANELATDATGVSATLNLVE